MEKQWYCNWCEAPATFKVVPPSGESQHHDHNTYFLACRRHISAALCFVMNNGDVMMMKITRF